MAGAAGDDDGVESWASAGERGSADAADGLEQLDKFACKGINEQVVRESADSIVANGMKDAGYQFVNIDDCWQTGRDAAGNIVADTTAFPHGIKAIADYVHSKGLKLGIYSDAGTMTCAKRPGSIGHEFQDAAQYAAWGVDYLKEDWCNTLPGQSSESSYTLMRNALAATARPIVFSICEWGSTKPWLWAESVGNLWRSTGDIKDCWSCGNHGYNGVTQILDQVADLYSYAGPGHWNDPDMLEVGNGGMTTEEYRSHFSLWAVLAAPLLAGNDIANMSVDTKEILLNKEVIAVDQDTLGAQGRRVKKTGDLEVWSKQMADGSRAVALLNRGAAAAEVRVNWMDVGYPAATQAAVRDLWAKKDIGRRADGYAATVPSHGVVMVMVRP